MHHLINATCLWADCDAVPLASVVGCKAAQAVTWCHQKGWGVSSWVYRRGGGRQGSVLGSGCCLFESAPCQLTQLGALAH
jgi:hypothetical protein